MATIPGDGATKFGQINASLLSDGSNVYQVYAEREGCSSINMDQNIEIIVEELVIDRSITYFGSEVCEASLGEVTVSILVGVEKPSNSSSSDRKRGASKASESSFDDGISLTIINILREFVCRSNSCVSAALLK